MNYDFADSMEYIIKDIAFCSDDFLAIIDLYIKNDVPFNLHPRFIIELLLEKKNFVEVEEKLNQYDYRYKNNWIYILYTLIPDNYINEEYLNKIYDFLK